MTLTPLSDWRLTNQDKYLMGASLNFRIFHVCDENPKWDHEHCVFCWAKVVDKKDYLDSNLIKEAYCTQDGGHWICPNCFSDFKDKFGWIMTDKKPPNKAIEPTPMLASEQASTGVAHL